MRREEAVDEYGVPVDVLTRPSTHPHLRSHLHIDSDPNNPYAQKHKQEQKVGNLAYCCLKHSEDAMKSRMGFINQRAAYNRRKLTADVAELNRVSKGDTFVSRAVLRVTPCPHDSIIIDDSQLFVVRC
jgi:hypothetical protein